MVIQLLKSSPKGGSGPFFVLDEKKSKKKKTKTETYPRLWEIKREKGGPEKRTKTLYPTINKTNMAFLTVT